MLSQRGRDGAATGPAALVYANGTVLERYEYDAYGNCSILEPNFAPDPDGKSDYGNNYLFTGRRVDILDNSSLKIQYNRNRYYDYYTGRWLTHDPLGLDPARGVYNAFAVIGQYWDGVNLYEYVQDNPTLKLDPLGLACSKKIGKKVWVLWDCPGAIDWEFYKWNSIMRGLEATSLSCCEFDGPPTVSSKTTRRVLWSGSLISERGPTFYHRSGDRCECYVYSTIYKWSQGIPRPPLWPRWLPWPFHYWMQTEITITICADGTTTGSAKNTTNKPNDWKATTEVY